MKKYLAFLLAAVLLVSVSGCGGENDSKETGAVSQAQANANDSGEDTEDVAENGAGDDSGDSNVTAPGELPIVKEKITLSAFMIQAAAISDLVDNDATKELEEITNIHLDIVSVPYDGYNEKRTILLSSGDYPDIFLQAENEAFTNEELMMYGNKQEVFIPLNDLIEKYGYEVKNRIEETDGLLADMTAPDGNIYGLPVWEQAYHVNYSQKMWMNQSWLDELGLSLPTTTDELYTVLEAFKENDPNGNGQADEIPLTGAIKWNNGQPQHFIMNAFIYTSRKNFFFVDDEGKLDFAPMQSEWKDGLTYIKKLYDNGLLDPGAFTQTIEQVKQIGTNPDDILLGAVTTMHPGHFLTISDEEKDARHKDYVAVPPLIGPDGTQYTAYFGGYSGGGFVISDTCKNPEAAFRLGDYLYGEAGSLLVSEGLEGKTWEMAKDGDLNILGEPATYTRLQYTHVSGQAHNYNWGGNIFRNRGSEVNGGLRGKWTYSQDVSTFDGYETRLFRETLEKYGDKEPDEIFTNVFLPVENTDEIFQMKVNIEDYIEQSMVRFITGDQDIEKDWDSYIQQLENLDIAKYIEIYDTAYQAKKAST